MPADTATVEDARWSLRESFHLSSGPNSPHRQTLSRNETGGRGPHLHHLDGKPFVQPVRASGGFARGGVGCRSRSRQTENPMPTTLVRLGSFQKSQMEVQHGLSRTAPPSGQQ